MSVRRLLFILESRATYGYSKNVITAAAAFPKLKIQTIVTGAHLMPELGNSVDLIRNDGIPISAEVPMAPADTRGGAWARALGKAVEGFANAFEELSPDIVVLSGDRAETFGACVAASYMNVPLAHIQAGDKSGHIDDNARMAIGKLAHIHLASCNDSAERLRRMGEEEWRINNVGAPQLDNILGRDYTADSVNVGEAEHDLSQPYILLVMHPILVEREEAAAQMAAALKAAVAPGIPVFCIYPNSDLGYQTMVAVIENERRKNFTALRNVDREEYLALLANAAVLVGNSSSGILEAPSFRIPVINIGNRQRGRPQASNILNCGYTTAEIAAAIGKALTNQAFRKACAEAVNPYGDGKSGERICNILQNVSLDRRLLDKQTIY
ncbi:MAG: UDP-N-acetylglucosamine 2-epimerase [Pseudomonadota bacterium]|nr:UDP-N-acetylglucosamine 2-epimerase [Pseudomonadota bacterium]